MSQKMRMILVPSLLLSTFVMARNNLSVPITSLFCPNGTSCDEASYTKATQRVCLGLYNEKLVSSAMEDAFVCQEPQSQASEVASYVELLLQQQEQHCVLVEHIQDDQFRVTPDAGLSEAVSLFVQDCSKNATKGTFFNCKNDNYVIDKNSNVVTMSGLSSVLLLPFQKPMSCDKQWPKTALQNDLFYLRPYGLPAPRSLTVTQCYNGPYSHQGKFALDFGFGDGSNVHSIKPGVVIKINDGAKYHCYSEIRKGDYYFKIYYNKTVHVDYNLNVCQSGDCGGYDFPDVCRQDKGVNQVFIQHPDHTISQYMHFKGTNQHIKFGDVVDEGEVIGQTGYSGWLTGPHLHMVVNQMSATAAGKVAMSSIPVTFKTNKGISYACKGNGEGITLAP